MSIKKIWRATNTESGQFTAEVSRWHHYTNLMYDFGTSADLEYEFRTRNGASNHPTAFTFMETRERQLTDDSGHSGAHAFGAPTVNINHRWTQWPRVNRRVTLLDSLNTETAVSNTEQARIHFRFACDASSSLGTGLTIWRSPSSSNTKCQSTRHFKINSK